MFEDMRTEQIPVIQQGTDDFGEQERRHNIVFRPKGTVSNSFSQAFGWLDRLRLFVRDYEQILIIAVLLILLLDCDDNIELLIAAGIMIYPLLK